MVEMSRCDLGCRDQLIVRNNGHVNLPRCSFCSGFITSAVIITPIFLARLRLSRRLAHHSQPHSRASAEQSCPLDCPIFPPAACPVELVVDVQLSERLRPK